MKPTTDLAKLQVSFRRRLSRLTLRLNETLVSDGPRRNAIVAWTTIELDNLVVELSRQFLISSLLRCRTAGGLRVDHAQPRLDQNDAALYVMSVLEPKKYKKLAQSSLTRRDETTIRDPSKIIQVANAAKLTNQGSIITALSINTASFSELGKARHFFAHRNIQTAGVMFKLAQDRTMPLPPCAWQVPDTPLPGSPATMLDEWVADVGTFANLLLS